MPNNLTNQIGMHASCGGPDVMSDCHLIAQPPSSVQALESSRDTEPDKCLSKQTSLLNEVAMPAPRRDVTVLRL